MIVKIWPIKADYAGQKGKVGGTQGLKNAVEYITDEKKTMDRNNESLEMVEMQMQDMLDGSAINMDPDFGRVLGYMANEDKIEGKYISGYLCEPSSATQEFNLARKAWNREEDGNVAFHMVQSFPPDLDISDAEVHQCGLELCKKLGNYQAVVCSHIHPVMDEDGVLHGVCKHNHILFNAYSVKDKGDPERKQVKYHDCTQTYYQLQIWNDEIALEHGLPIIRNPDNMRTYSWAESKTANEGLSWKQRIRMDIENARRATSNWDEFCVFMKSNGYDIKDGKHVTYKTPDEHKARGSSLGREYTKEGLQMYWKAREEILQDIQPGLKTNHSPALSKEYEEKHYTVAIPIGIQGQESGRKFYHLPLERNDLSSQSVQTYFDPNELYDICDVNGTPLSVASGQDLIDYFEDKESDRERNKRAEEERKSWAEQEEARQQRHRKEEKEKEENAYFNLRFLNSRTKKPYRVRFYDSSGRRMSDVEVMFVLAMVVLRKESGLWLPSTVPPEYANDACYAKTDWKVQNMLDSMRFAREEGIESLADIDRRLDAVGAAYSRARSAMERNTRIKEKMESLKDSVVEYERVRDVAEKLYAMPDGPEKTKKLQENQEILDRYKKAKASLHAYGINDEAALIDFKIRWRQVEANIKEATERYDETRESYRRLKKLHYNTALAQNERYCYGPEYPIQEPTTAEKDLGRRQNDREDG